MHAATQPRDAPCKGSDEDRDAYLERAREVFGVREFRPGQRVLLEAVLRGQDALGILPTGGGKSLIYQLASLFLPRPVVVVTPDCFGRRPN